MTNRKNRLILILGMLLLTGFIVTSLGSYFVSRSSLRSQISQNELPITSDNIYSEIQRDLFRPIFISSLMASDTFLRDWVMSGEENSKQIVKYLKEIQDQYGTFTSFFVSEPTGIYYQSEGILKNISPDDKRDEWYYRVRDMKEDYEINFDPDMANSDAMTIFINYRVYDYEGNYIGVTGVGLTINAVKDVIDDYQEKYDRNIYFIDKLGTITLHSSSFSDETASIYDIPGISSLADEILLPGDKSLKYRNDGNSVYVNSRYIPELDWVLIVSQTDEKATRNILNALFINLMICFAITGIVLVITNITITVYQNKLEIMATTDKLTGLYNRQAFDVMVSQTIKEAHRKESLFSVLLLDIDHFKKVNDNYGHLQGDAVLKNIAQVCIANTRDSDIVCRWGGEEFIILLKECTIGDAVKMAEKIRSAIESTTTQIHGKSIDVSASLGVTAYVNTDKEDSLFGRADKALYIAKKKGRNRAELVV